MRGVPRERLAISSAPSASSGALSSVAERPTMLCSSCGVIELEAGDDAEAVAQRVGQHAGAGRRADQRERRQVKLDRARGRTFADHDVDLEILQRRVEDFLDDRADRRWISSMNSTSCGSRLVRMAARSPARSSTGPEVERRLTPISWATMWASVVLPSPGGPKSSTWSSDSLRWRAAWMKISSCSRILTWPV